MAALRRAFVTPNRVYPFWQFILEHSNLTARQSNGPGGVASLSCLLIGKGAVQVIFKVPARAVLCNATEDNNGPHFLTIDHFPPN